MRISDWSSDVCSSDLFAVDGFLREYSQLQSDYEQEHAAILDTEREIEHKQAELAAVREQVLSVKRGVDDNLPMQDSLMARPGERRVGKECVGTCIAGWARDLREQKRNNKYKQ